LVLFSTIVLSVLAQEPNPEARARVDAVFEALSSGSPERFEATARENFSPGLFARRSPQERKRMVEHLRAEFGELRRERELAREGGMLELHVRGAQGGTARLEVTLEPTPPHRITRFAIEVGDRDEGAASLTAPPINGAMAPEELSRALDAYIAPLMATDSFAGVVLVARDGKTIFERGYGLASREAQTTITPATRFNVASIGKAFTKVAVGQLVARGKLTLDDTIGALLPDYPNAAARVATVDQLLNHRAGIVDFFGPNFDKASKEQFGSNGDYLRFIAPQPLLFAPGSDKQYCNGCYIVLGAIIERLSGVPYEQYIAENVFGRAGMKGASFLAEGEFPDVANGYTRQASGGAALRRSGGMHGLRGSAAGGSYARAADLLAFDNALREQRLLDSEMTGWFLRTETGEGSGEVRVRGGYGIAGGAPGTNGIIESDGVWTVVVLGNLDPPNAGRIGTPIMRQLAR
jgi:CubicO group peptidase (beta-lactamase class C family)